MDGTLRRSRAAAPDTGVGRRSSRRVGSVPGACSTTAPRDQRQRDHQKQREARTGSARHAYATPTACGRDDRASARVSPDARIEHDSARVGGPVGDARSLDTAVAGPAVDGSTGVGLAGATSTPHASTAHHPHTRVDAGAVAADLPAAARHARAAIGDALREKACLPEGTDDASTAVDTSSARADLGGGARARLAARVEATPQRVAGRACVTRGSCRAQQRRAELRAGAGGSAERERPGPIRDADLHRRADHAETEIDARAADAREAPGAHDAGTRVDAGACPADRSHRARRGPGRAGCFGAETG